MRKRYTIWNAPGALMQAQQWKAKLTEAQGNITQAGTLLDFSKSYAMRLTKFHGLNDYAKTLRIQATGRAYGKPPK